MLLKSRANAFFPEDAEADLELLIDLELPPLPQYLAMIDLELLHLDLNLAYS
jgi:hypothetical protein